jgi:HAD superfamily hydrolase (TIGR01509 family)
VKALVKAVLFDLDLTLWRPTSPPDFDKITQLQAEALTPLFASVVETTFDFAHFVRDFWASLLERDAEAVAEGEYREVHGPAIMQSALAAQGLDVPIAEAQRWWDVINLVPLSEFNIQPYDDAIATLEELRARQLRIAVVTNRTMGSSLLAPHIEAAGLSAHIDALVASGDLGVRKPHALPFTTALQALAVEARDAMMVGDSLLNDVLPAEALGMTAVLRHEGEPPAEAEGRLAIPRLSDLLPLLEGR